MAASEVVTARPVTVIEPRRGWTSLGLGELWEYRELLYFLTWRDVKVRYKQTVLGAAWAVLQPFLTMVVFSLFFGKLAGVPSDGLPYPLFSYAALVPWTFFATGLTQSSNRMVGSANLIRKIYFPRLVLPISSILAGLVDFAVAFAVLAAALMPWFHVFDPRWSFEWSLHLLWLPLLVLLAFVTALGAGLWLAAMNVQFRDVRHAVPFLVQIWLFATPIAYSSSLLAERWQIVYALNPMVGVVEGFRWALLGAETGPGPMILVSGLVSLALLLSGAYYFRRVEKTFADIV
ncbi:MAG TPA: ABC transporter permease [Thermoanaerobaculia bacterium]|nr:ABC transporter permease [Thermoanaerobaculia bacterium]